MNVFVLNRDPVLAAQSQCDKHVVKMVLETAQLLCSPYEPGAAPYKRAYYNHPCAIWARASLANYRWLLEHGQALALEYRYRYAREHRSEDVIEWCGVNVEALNLPNVGLTPWPLVMPVEYQHADSVAAYRAYYQTKAKFARWWRGRTEPEWWSELAVAA